MKKDARGFLYQIPNHKPYEEDTGCRTSIFVRCRPRSFDADCSVVYDEDVADAYLSVTDTFTTSPKDKICMWFPWNETRTPIPEMFYATNKALCWWVFYQHLKSIQIFCDAGTHRSVTVFGAFLRTYFSEKVAKEIVNNRVGVGHFEDKIHADAAHPLEYMDGYLEQFPVDRLLFKAMGKDWLGRLDGYSQDIYELVKDRYGKKD